MLEGAVHRLTVDGEVFDVRPNDTGGHHFDWVSGPNPGYGFSTGKPMIFVPVGEDGVVRTEADDTLFTRQIREFLAQIDPETGYIGD
jgi:hypothetical protein